MTNLNRRIAILLQVLTFAAPSILGNWPSAVQAPVRSTSSVVPKIGNIGQTERTYSNRELGFEITLPAGWQMVGDEFKANLSASGYDLSLKPPDNVGDVGRIQVGRAIKNVKELFLAVHNVDDKGSKAVFRCAIEDLTMVPAVHDAVDYFDLMRSQFSVMRLPPDLQYSETKAEALGPKQFAFLDISTKAGKKRMYATVRRGVAIVFTLTYENANDLSDIRKAMASANFAFK